MAWLISFGVLINRIGSSVAYFLALYMNQHLGHDAIESGWTVSMWGLGSVLGSFLGGWLCDRAGPRNVLIGGHIVSGIFYLSFLLTDHYLTITLLAFAVGLADYSLRPTIAVAMIGATDRETRARSNALRRLALNIGVGIGAASGGLLFSINPNFLFWLDGLTSLAGALIFFYIMPPSPHKEAQDISLPPSNILARRPWHDKLFLLILLADTVVAFITAQTKNAYPLYLASEYQLDASYFGFLLSVNAVIIILFELPLVHYLRRFSFALLCVLGAICYGLGFGLLPLGSAIWWIWSCWLSFTLGEMLTSPASMAMVQDRASRSASPGAYMGLFTASYSVMGFIGPALGGFIYQKASADYLWALCLFAGGLSSYLFYKIGRYHAKA